MSTRKPEIVGLSISMPIIATTAVILRFHARRLKKLHLEADDYLVLGALIFCYGLSATTLAAVYLGGLGGHLELGPGNIPVHPEKFTPLAQSFWVLQFICIPAVGLTKLSVLFFYKKIFTPRHFRIAAWVMIVLIAGWNIACFLVNLLNCLPIELNWRPVAGASGKCLDIAKIFWGVTLTDIITDALILAMPWPQISKLQMSRTRKAQLGGVFMLGFLVVGAGIARCVLSAEGVTSQSTDLDYTYSRAPAVYWTVIEADVGVISACLPTLRPLLASLKFADIGSSLRKALYWRSSSRKSSQASNTPWSSRTDDTLNLVHGQKVAGPYVRATTVDTWAMPMAPLHPQHGITVQREFYRGDQAV